MQTAQAALLDTFTDSNTRERKPYEADGIVASTAHLWLQRDPMWSRHSISYVIQFPTWPVRNALLLLLHHLISPFHFPSSLQCALSTSMAVIGLNPSSFSLLLSNLPPFHLGTLLNSCPSFPTNVLSFWSLLTYATTHANTHARAHTYTCTLALIWISMAGGMGADLGAASIR